MCDCPYKLSRVFYVVAQKQSAVGFQDNILRQILRVVYAFAPFQRKTENGFFIPYLDNKKPGLIIHLDPQGAVQRSFKTQETRETVYGVEAAKDRKIIITGGKTTNP